MKLVFKTNNGHLYLVKLPNYFNIDATDELLDSVKFEIPMDEVITEHHFYGDNMPTLEERKQIDCHGKIIDSPKELHLS